MSKPNRKLNIAVICESIEYIIGGSYASARRFVNALTKRGHKIILIAAKHNIKEKLVEPLNVYKIYRSPTLLTIGPDKYKLPLHTKKILTKIIKVEKIDLVYIVMVTPSGTPAIACAHKLGIPVVSHFHAQPEAMVIVNPILILIKEPVLQYIKIFYNKTDLILCPSEFGKEYLIKHKVRKPIEIISNGVDLTKFKKFIVLTSDKIFNKYKIQKNAFKIITLGRLSAEKSIKTLIQAMPNILVKHPNTQVLIVGYGQEYKKLKNLINKKKLKKHVFLLGAIQNFDIPKLLNIGNLFVHPSWLELEGMVVLEAMACGLPLVVSDAKTSAVNTLINKNGLIFKNKNHKDLANKINYLIENPKLLLKMKARSYKLAQKYNFEKSVDKLEDVFLKLTI